jgi:hypothetical protein
MMRFAAYYGFSIDCNCNIAAYNYFIDGRNLPDTCSVLNRFEPSLEVNYPGCQPQVSEDAPTFLLTFSYLNF